MPAWVTKLTWVTTDQTDRGNKTIKHEEQGSVQEMLAHLKTYPKVQSLSDNPNQSGNDGDDIGCSDEWQRKRQQG